MNDTKCANQNGKVLKSICEINTYHITPCIRYVAKLVLFWFVCAVRANSCLIYVMWFPLNVAPTLPHLRTNAAFYLTDLWESSLSLSISNMQDMRRSDSCTAKYHHVKYLVFRSHTLPLCTYVWMRACVLHRTRCTVHIELARIWKLKFLITKPSEHTVWWHTQQMEK